MSELSREVLCQRERILEWMAGKIGDSINRPVLLSDMQREMGQRFNHDAFDGLVRDGVICAEFPEAKRGDSGRQFWNFAHWGPLPPAPKGEME